jgi:hypothetical protein
MAFTFIRPQIERYEAAQAALKAKAKKAKNKAAPKPDAPAKPLPVIDLSQPGRLRIADVCRVLGVSRTTLYLGVKEGRYPASSGKDGNMPYWNTDVIRVYLDK